MEVGTAEAVVVVMVETTNARYRFVLVVRRAVAVVAAAEGGLWAEAGETTSIGRPRILPKVLRASVARAETAAADGAAAAAAHPLMERNRRCYTEGCLPRR